MYYQRWPFPIYLGLLINAGLAALHGEQGGTVTLLLAIPGISVMLWALDRKHRA